jgi:ABC-type transport system substrate-binding protein
MTDNCKAQTVDFVAVQGNTQMLAVYDEITSDLAKIGFTVNTRFVPQADYVAIERNGSYNMLFTRTWGAPYDPHTYLNSWAVASHAEYSAISGLEVPLTREILLGKISAAQEESDPIRLTQRWRGVLEEVHKQAIFLPLWGVRIPYVLNRRLLNFQGSFQAYTYPLAGIRINTGSFNVSVAPGSSSGSLFKSVGPLNPHQYFPNEIFASDWVYEGLVRYGQDGEIVPALATSWKTENTSQGQRFTFTLRQNVKFHDGSDWNCTVAKLNFDHVLSDTVRKRHAWFGTAQYLQNWTCNPNGDFVLETSKPFYPLLQELTYSRPLVFVSASAFANGTDSNPDTQNSCASGGFGPKWAFLEQNVTCLGVGAPIGTGPFRFVEREYLPGSNQTIDAKVSLTHTSSSSLSGPLSLYECACFSILMRATVLV